MCKYVVIDLEMCNVPYVKRTENYMWRKETVQIGAVLLDEEYQIVDQFNCYVTPQYGAIDLEIHKLTGISRKNLINAPIMEEALKEFVEWLPISDFKLVAWSDSDKAQIRYEMEVKQIKNEVMKLLQEEWIDCQKCFGQMMCTDKQYRLTDALFMADIETKGKEHDGLDDAYNTALLFAKLQREEELQLNPRYVETTKEEYKTLSYSMGDLFNNICLQGIA